MTEIIFLLIFIRIRFRNLALNVTEFNLFTAYNAPGQENITDEDDKEKISVQPIIESIEKCTKEQLEDIVNGWMRHIKKVFKLYEQKVLIEMLLMVAIEFPQQTPLQPHTNQFISIEILFRCPMMIVR